MSTSKITKRDNFNSIISVLSSNGYEELADVMRHEITLLDNKAGKKSAKVVAEQTNFDNSVLSFMSDTPSTVTEIYCRMGKPDGVATPKITASLKRLVTDGKVKNIKDGKKSLYVLS